MGRVANQWRVASTRVRDFRIYRVTRSATPQAHSGEKQSQPVARISTATLIRMDSINRNRLGDPMRAVCLDLTVTSMLAGHWLPLERKADTSRPFAHGSRAKSFDGGIGEVRSHTRSGRPTLD